MMMCRRIYCYTASLLVPRLIIQPIIENAFEHALEKKVQGGLLIIGFQKREEALCITVEDNGERLSDHELDALQQKLAGGGNIGEMEITGIINVHWRLKYKFGENSGLFFTRSELGGLKAIIRIVLEKGRSDV